MSDPNVSFAGGSVELTIPFSRTCGAESHMFGKKINKDYAARAESGFHLGKRSV